MGTKKTIIESRKGFKVIDWKELSDYRDLFLFLVWRNIRTRYAQSTLGVGWAVLQPLFSMLVFTIIFGRLAKVDSNGLPYAIFSYTALVPWTFFANSLTEGTASLVSNANMLSKVYFPRVVLPLASVAAKAVDFIIAMLFLAVLMLWFKVVPTSGIFVVPFLIIILLLASSGLALWFTALAVQFRDINYAMNFIVQLLMYAAPVVYPTTLIPERFQFWYALNPMVGVIEGFRSALLDTIDMPWTWILSGTVSALFLFVTGLVYFRSRERIFADVA